VTTSPGRRERPEGEGGSDCVFISETRMMDANESPKHSYGYAQYGYRDFVEVMKKGLII
jgi:hypothetical protein